MLELNSLGPLDVRINGVPAELRVDQRRAYLLIYLAETKQAQKRKRLAQLLWPHTSPSNAITRLRGLLARMRREGFDSYLHIERHTVTLQKGEEISYDLKQLRNQIREANRENTDQLLKVYDLYQGPFLDGVDPDHFPEFGEWANALRIESEALATHAFSMLVPKLLTEGKIKQAGNVGERLTQVSPYEEKAQILYIQALVADGRIADALLHANGYRRLMSDEFPDHQLSQTFTKLVNQLRRPGKTAQFFSAKSMAYQDQAEQQYASNDDLQTNAPSFKQIIGREGEREQLQTLLDNGHRLISVVGLGGVGKTSFMRSEQRNLAKHFEKGLHFIDLRRETTGGRSDADLLLDSLVNVLNLKANPQQNLFEQLSKALNDGKRALILDNFETAPSLPSEINRLLEDSPQLTIFTTTRHRLNLQNEVVLQLSGLPTGTPNNKSRGTGTIIADSDSAKLFAHCAQRILPSFSINGSNWEQVNRFCTLVGGLPLAIELGAMQLDFYSLNELIGAVTKNLDLLSTTKIDIPAGHQSIISVLSSSWESLSPVAQNVLVCCTVFANAWHRDALTTIAPADSHVYRELINASLLQIEEPGWFSLHPLVKQFVQTKYTVTVDAKAHYAEYFLGLLDLGRQLQEQSPIEETTNQLLLRYKADLVASWDWAVAQHKWDLLSKAVTNYGHFLVTNGQNLQGIHAYKTLLSALNPAPNSPSAEVRLGGQAALLLAHMLIFIKEDYYQKSSDWYEKSLQWLEKSGTPFEIATAHADYGYVLTGINGIEQKKGLYHLEKAAKIAEENNFVDIQLLVEISLISNYSYTGEWKKLERISQNIADNLPRYSGKPVPRVIGICEIALFFGDWVEAGNRLIVVQNHFPPEIRKQPNFRRVFSQYQWESLHLQGRLAEAIELLTNIIKNSENLPPTGEIMYQSCSALLYASNNQPLLADKALARAKHLRPEVSNKVMQGISSVIRSAASILNENWDDAFEIACQALKIGRELRGVNIIFSSVFLLAALRKEQISPDLYDFVMKAAIVSPALYYQLRPAAIKLAQEQGILIEGDDSVYRATNLEKAEALAEQVSEALGI